MNIDSLSDSLCALVNNDEEMSQDLYELTWEIEQVDESVAKYGVNLIKVDEEKLTLQVGQTEILEVPFELPIYTEHDFLVEFHNLVLSYRSDNEHKEIVDTIKDVGRSQKKIYEKSNMGKLRNKVIINRNEKRIRAMNHNNRDIKVSSPGKKLDPEILLRIEEGRKKIADSTFTLFIAHINDIVRGQEQIIRFNRKPDKMKELYQKANLKTKRTGSSKFVQAFDIDGNEIVDLDNLACFAHIFLSTQVKI